MIEHIFGIVSLILFVWSGVLVWATWQIGCMVRSLAEERRELRRWKRLAAIYERQRQPWQ